MTTQTAPSKCGDPDHEPCPCGDETHEVQALKFDTLTQYQNEGWVEQPKADKDGFPVVDEVTGEIIYEWKTLWVYDADGNKIKETVQLPHAVNPLTHSVLDDTGLAPAVCKHGLSRHPMEAVMRSPHARYATTWIRAKYLSGETGMVGRCVVCLGQPRPADLCTPRNESGVASVAST